MNFFLFLLNQYDYKLWAVIRIAGHIIEIVIKIISDEETQTHESVKFVRYLRLRNPSFFPGFRRKPKALFRIIHPVNHQFNDSTVLSK